MKPSLFAASVFALATATLGTLAWHQYRELIQLRGAALIPEERADLRERIAELEKENRELSDQLLAARSTPDEAEFVPDAATAEAPPEAAPRRGPSGGRGQGQRAFREALAKPEVQAALTLQRKFEVGERYAALFRNLNLSPDQAEKLKTLLAERRSTMQDTMMVAREQGINPRTNREAFSKLVDDAQKQFEASVRSTIGDAGLAQLQHYERTMPERTLVNRLQQRLTSSDSPLTFYQAEQLVDVLYRNDVADDRPARSNLGMMSGGRVSAGITGETINQAQGVLSASQLEVLRQMHEQQQAQREVREALRQARRGGSSPSPRPDSTRPGG